MCQSKTCEQKKSAVGQKTLTTYKIKDFSGIIYMEGIMDGYKGPVNDIYGRIMASRKLLGVKALLANW